MFVRPTSLCSNLPGRAGNIFRLGESQRHFHHRVYAYQHISNTMFQSVQHSHSYYWIIEFLVKFSYRETTKNYKCLKTMCSEKCLALTETKYSRNEKLRYFYVTRCVRIEKSSRLRFARQDGDKKHLHVFVGALLRKGPGKKLDGGP
jgi:hypothetical protein